MKKYCTYLNMLFLYPRPRRAAWVISRVRKQTKKICKVTNIIYTPVESVQIATESEREREREMCGPSQIVYIYIYIYIYTQSLSYVC